MTLLGRNTKTGPGPSASLLYLFTDRNAARIQFPKFTVERSDKSGGWRGDLVEHLI